MSQPTHVFGIDLNSSEYELHPSEKDTPQTLSGNHCCTIRFSETLSSQLENFLHNNNECHDGMTIGSIEFSTDKRGKISFDGVSDMFSNCILTVMKEPNINTELYETQYDDPPSNAMFLRRKGFVHSKLILKQGPSNEFNLILYAFSLRFCVCFLFRLSPPSSIFDIFLHFHSNRKLKCPPNKNSKINQMTKYMIFPLHSVAFDRRSLCDNLPLRG